MIIGRDPGQVQWVMAKTLNNTHDDSHVQLAPALPLSSVYLFLLFRMSHLPNTNNNYSEHLSEVSVTFINSLLKSTNN